MRNFSLFLVGWTLAVSLASVNARAIAVDEDESIGDSAGDPGGGGVGGGAGGVGGVGGGGSPSSSTPDGGYSNYYSGVNFDGIPIFWGGSYTPPNGDMPGYHVTIVMTATPVSSDQAPSEGGDGSQGP